jgi:hypothetical protein
MHGIFDIMLVAQIDKLLQRSLPSAPATMSVHNKIIHFAPFAKEIEKSLFIFCNIKSKKPDYSITQKLIISRFLEGIIKNKLNL